MDISINIGQLLQAVIVISIGWFGKMVARSFDSMGKEIQEVKKAAVGARQQVGKVNGSLREIKMWQRQHEKSDDERHEDLTEALKGVRKGVQ